MLDRAAIDHHLKDLTRIAISGYAIGLHIRFAAPSLSFFSYDERWLAHYTEQAYGLRDPLIGWGLSQTGAIRWSAMALPDPFEIMKQAAEYGLRFGAAVSCGPISSRTIAGLSRCDREFTEDELRQLSRHVTALHKLTEPPASLTVSQREALLLVAAGDRHAAAAAKLGISESALKARLIAARERLQARTTAEAIQRAKEYRLL